MLQQVTTWAVDNENIRAMLLTGSKGNPDDSTDFLSDDDIAVIGTDFDFLGNDDWLNFLGERWICIHEQFELAGNTIPTRLVLFPGGRKIDFSFIPSNVIAGFAESKTLPDGFNQGFKILLDKDGLCRALPSPIGIAFVVAMPTEKEFENNKNEFWFEVYHVAKYLARNDLWTAKFRDWSAKQFLLQMLQWQHASKTKWNFSPKPDGKGMEGWIDIGAWSRLHTCFGKFDRDDAWKALENTIDLYRDVSRKVCFSLDWVYDQTLDDRISGWVSTLKQNDRSL